MARLAKPAASSRQTTGIVRHRIVGGGERLWQFADFPDLPFMPLAQALSRLARQGELQRLSKGFTIAPAIRRSDRAAPIPPRCENLPAAAGASFPPASPQPTSSASRPRPPNALKIATTALSLPRKLVGDAIIHTRRPAAWAGLSEEDAALLDFLRGGGKTSELSPAETTRRTIRILSEPGRLARLLKVSEHEPPRVRAILGAIGEQLGVGAAALRRIRASLNALSRFNFGPFRGLAYAQNWQAKERAKERPREAV